MSRRATKALGNRYCQARLKAAEYNEKLLTRVGAVECLPGVTEDSLKKYELDISKPPNIVVALMADAYNEPELRSWYCANECPLGADCREIQEMPAERKLLRLQNALEDTEDAVRILAKIMEDGQISREEQDMIPELLERVRELKRRAEEMMSSLEKAERKGQFE